MSINVVVVDDEAEITDLIELYLAGSGFKVQKFYSGAGVMEYIENNKVDLAILDIMLPDTDGYSLCEKIREQFNFPIIMLTAKGEEIDKIRGLSIGADAYLTKPFRPLELVANVKAQIEVERKNDLITYLAHDIRTPLASIIGYLNLLDEIPDIPMEQRAKYVGITLKKAYRLEELINEFFDITRFNLSSLPLEKEEIHLKFMLEQLTEEFYPMLSAGNRRADVVVPEELLVYGDGDKLARVFSNLLKNAIAYSYENTTIVIEGKTVENQVKVTVTNQGKQIPKEKLNMIFDKFFRLDTSRATTTGGAGLGLAIAKEIVVSHGGEIDAASNEKNTVFTVMLPV